VAHSISKQEGPGFVDLYWAHTAQAALPVDTAQVRNAFKHYMQDESTTVPRSEFLAHKVGFCRDMDALLKQSLEYDHSAASVVVIERLLSRLSE
jgi:hypothetical protein